MTKYAPQPRFVEDLIYKEINVLMIRDIPFDVMVQCYFAGFVVDFEGDGVVVLWNFARDLANKTMFRRGECPLYLFRLAKAQSF